MPEVKVFFDTNVLLYLLSEDTVKADRAEDLLTGRGVISVQVLNEFAVVCSRKMGLSWSETKDILGPIRAVCDIEPLSLESHERGIEVAERYGFSFFDVMIVASALGAGCNVLYSEDLQHDQLIGNRLRVRNPFVS